VAEEVEPTREWKTPPRWNGNSESRVERVDQKWSAKAFNRVDGNHANLRQCARAEVAVHETRIELGPNQ